MTRRDEALGYVTGQGWRVFPLKGKVPATPRGFKDATQDAEVIERWWADSNPNIGVRTGSGLLVVDVDERHGGFDTLHELGIKLPDTPCSKTGGGGAHYFLHTDKYVRSKNNVWPGIDVKAAGGYVVAPSSTHPTGRPYEWDIHPDELSRATAPSLLLDRLREWTKAKPIPEVIPMKERNDTLTSIAGTFRRRGLTEDEIFVALGAVAKRCEGHFPGKEVARIAKSVASYDAAPWALNPRGYAERVLAECGVTGVSSWVVLSELYSIADADGRVSIGYELLGRKTHLEKSTVSRTISKLARKGLVRQGHAERGKRSVLYLSTDPLPEGNG